MFYTELKELTEPLNNPDLPKGRAVAIIDQMFKLSLGELEKIKLEGGDDSLIIPTINRINATWNLMAPEFLERNGFSNILANHPAFSEWYAKLDTTGLVK